MWGKELSFIYLLMRIQTGPATLEISVENPQKAKSKSTICPSCTTLWSMKKGLSILFHRYLLSHVCCCSIYSNWAVEATYPPDEWVLKTWNIYTMEYYSAVNK